MIVAVAVAVRVAVALAVMVGDGVKVRLGVGVRVVVAVAVGNGVGVSVHNNAISVSFMVGDGCIVGVRSTLGVTSHATNPMTNPPNITRKNQPQRMD